jgi:hypothetical protein
VTRESSQLWGPPASYAKGRGGGGCFPGLKRRVCEADCLNLPKAEVKNEWLYISTPPYAFIVALGTSL